MDLFHILLYLHVLGAIIAFGPTFSLPIVGAMGGKEPAHGNFALRVGLAISSRRIIPLAILQGITGVGLIFTSSIDLGRAIWLQSAIVLYAIALGYAMAVQTPVVKRLIEMTAGGPPPAGAGSEGGPPPGPPPAMLALVRKAQRGGMLLAGLVAVIVFLMVVKPGV